MALHPCLNCKKRFVLEDICETCIRKELEKCKASPYYFMTKYCLVDGKPFTTPLTEEEFNKQLKEIAKQLKNN